MPPARATAPARLARKVPATSRNEHQQHTPSDLMTAAKLHGLDQQPAARTAAQGRLDANAQQREANAEHINWLTRKHLSRELLIQLLAQVGRAISHRHDFDLIRTYR
jgi:hypothetical protein